MPSSPTPEDMIAQGREEKRKANTKAEEWYVTLQGSSKLAKR